MATNIEIEAKALISKEDYQKVLSYYKADRFKRIKQTNYYLDTNEFSLKKMGIGLRIREKDDFVLSLKAPMAEGLLEQNETITWKQYEDFKENGIFPKCPIKDFLMMLDIIPNDLKIQTSLVTERVEIPEIDSGLFSIDKNSYNGLTDYELELEGNSLEKAKEALKTLCENAKVVYNENLKNKQSRALETIKK